MPRKPNAPRNWRQRSEDRDAGYNRQTRRNWNQDADYGNPERTTERNPHINPYRGYSSQGYNYDREFTFERGRRLNQEYFGQGRKYQRDMNPEDFGSEGNYTSGAQIEYSGGREGYQSEDADWLFTDAWNVPGPYFGIGPRNYGRSDERIVEDVCERLTWHGQIDASGIQVEVQNGEVTLRGSVGSRRTKRLAEDVIDRVPGVADIHNRLRIQSEAGQQKPEPTRTTEIPGE